MSQGTISMKSNEIQSPDTNPEPDLAQQIQEALMDGSSVEWVRVRFHLSEGELRDLCPDLFEIDEGWERNPNPVTGY